MNPQRSGNGWWYHPPQFCHSGESRNPNPPLFFKKESGSKTRVARATVPPMKRSSLKAGGEVKSGMIEKT